jgi:beta-glucosidase
LRTLNGGWSYTWQGNVEENFQKFVRDPSTIYESISRLAGQQNVKFVEGANFTDQIDIDAAVMEAELSDFIVLVVGDECFIETQGAIIDSYLSEPQRNLANRLIATSKPIILVFLSKICY